MTGYLFEPSVLDVELLGVNEVKQFAVLFPKGEEKDGLFWLKFNRSVQVGIF